MHVSVTQARRQFAKLIRQARTGEDVVLTLRGAGVVRVVPVPMADRPDPVARRALLAAVQDAAGAKARPGPCAARSQDFLYG